MQYRDETQKEWPGNCFPGRVTLRNERRRRTMLALLMHKSTDNRDGGYYYHQGYTRHHRQTAPCISGADRVGRLVVKATDLLNDVPLYRQRLVCIGGPRMYSQCVLRVKVHTDARTDSNYRDCSTQEYEQGENCTHCLFPFRLFQPHICESIHMCSVTLFTQLDVLEEEFSKEQGI
jgi:hypothetical protein